MCRIESVHRDLDRYQQFMMAGFLSPDTRVWNGSVFSAPITSPDGGEVTVISYLAREGEAIPLPEQID